MACVGDAAGGTSNKQVELQVGTVVVRGRQLNAMIVEMTAGAEGTEMELSVRRHTLEAGSRLLCFPRHDGDGIGQPLILLSMLRTKVGILWSDMMVGVGVDGEQDIGRSLSNYWCYALTNVPRGWNTFLSFIYRVCFSRDSVSGALVTSGFPLVHLLARFVAITSLPACGRRRTLQGVLTLPFPCPSWLYSSSSIIFWFPSYQ